MLIKNKKASLGSFFKLPNPGLRAYIEHIIRGNPDDYRPPFFNKEERSKVLEIWQKRMDSFDWQKFQELYSFEMDMKSKVGPMSIQLPLKDRIESIEQYYTCVELPSKPIDRRAISATIKFFSRAGGISLRSMTKTLANMKLSTNSGVWLFTKRRNVVETTMNAKWYVSNEGMFFVSDGRTYQNASTLGWRGQEGGLDDDDVKQRVVWMNSFLQNALELQFYQPAIEAFQNNDCIPALISMDRVDQEITALFDTKGPNDDVICTDFSKFDQHYNKDLQQASKEVLWALSDHSEATRKWFDDIYPEKFRNPLVCSEDLIYFGPHGMGSGSGGTNFDEDMSHKTMQFEAAILNNAKLNEHSMAYGDDGILTYPGITVEQVVQAYTSHGQEMNPTKQYVSKHDCVVLRRWHGMNYRVNGTMVGVYSTFRALGRLLAQERFYDPEKWSAEMVELRAYSIIENCKWHPYFHEFIDFVITGDKFRLGLDIPGFLEPENLERKAKEAIEAFGDDFLGYTKSQQSDKSAQLSGINSWEIVKYLRTLK